MLYNRDYDFFDGISYVSGSEAPEFTCFCCGVCCSKYSVGVSLDEGMGIAAWFNFTWDDWQDKYTDPSLSRGELFILRRRPNGLCVFLEPGEDGKTFKCRIHECKPALCRDWLASLFQPDCQEGLAKYWGLTVSPSGQIEGPREKLKEFYQFLSQINGGISFAEPETLSDEPALEPPAAD
ncbi:MAG: YkgJ family cysteine cluster protein [Chloroflexota bacterium]